MFYERLRLVCKKRGTNVKSVLDQVGISSANTGKWKSGGHPTVANLTKMSEILDCSIDYLLGKSEEMDLDKKNPSLDSLESKEVLRQALIREGIIPSDRPMTDSERNALLAFAETYFKRSEE